MSSPVAVRVWERVITCGCGGGGCHHLWLWGWRRVSSPVVVGVEDVFPLLVRGVLDGCVGYNASHRRCVPPPQTEKTLAAETLHEETAGCTQRVDLHTRRCEEGKGVKRGRGKGGKGTGNNPRV